MGGGGEGSLNSETGLNIGFLEHQIWVFGEVLRPGEGEGKEKSK